MVGKLRRTQTFPTLCGGCIGTTVDFGSHGRGIGGIRRGHGIIVGRAGNNYKYFIGAAHLDIVGVSGHSAAYRHDFHPCLEIEQRELAFELHNTAVGAAYR